MSRTERKKHETQIIKLNRLTEQPKVLGEIGSRLVREAIRNVAEEKIGQKISDPMVVRTVNKGEKVPADLIGEPNLVISPEGIAASGWGKSWCNLIIWGRSWQESTAELIYPGLNLSNPLTRYNLETQLTNEEMEVLEKLQLIN